MNSVSFWEQLVFKDYKAARVQFKNTGLPYADTMFMVASNRATQFDQPKFMSEERGEKHLNYFLVFVQQGKWNIWHTSFKTAMAAMQQRNKDWVVYTEGFGKIFTTGLYRGVSMATQYDVNVLYLDYPSYSTRKKMLGNYYFALDNAKQSGEDFAPLFDTIKRYRMAGKMGNGNLSMFFHSMGNNMMRSMIREAKISKFNDIAWVNNLILNSACVPQKEHAKWVNQIAFAQRIYINYNPKDATLSGANFMSLKKQLGQQQSTETSSQAVYVNFNPLCSHNHSNFLSLPDHKPTSPAAIAYYSIILHGDSVMLGDEKVFKKNAYRKRDYTLQGSATASPRITNTGRSRLKNTGTADEQQESNDSTLSTRESSSSASVH